MRRSLQAVFALAALAAPALAAAQGARGFLELAPALEGAVGLDTGPALPAPTGAAAPLSYGRLNDRFRGMAGFGDAVPADGLGQAGLSAPMAYHADDGWSLLAAPSFDYFREDGAAWRDSLAWGALLAVSKRIAERRVLGVGVGVYDGLDETRVFPYLVVDWEFNERWHLTNPLAAGPTGPAGLELRYRFDENWVVGAGGAYRTYRFRLDDAGVAPGGIGEERGFAAYLRFGRDFGPRYSLDVYAGAIFDGELKLDNGAGDAVLRTRYDTAPLMGFTFSGRF